MIETEVDTTDIDDEYPDEYSEIEADDTPEAEEPTPERPLLLLRFDERLTCGAVIEYVNAPSSAARLIAFLTEYGGLEPGALDTYEVDEFRALEVLMWSALVQYGMLQPSPIRFDKAPSLRAVADLEANRLAPGLAAQWFAKHTPHTRDEILTMPGYLVIDPLHFVGKATGADWLR